MMHLGASYALNCVQIICPELHKINDHQVDTALQGDWQDYRQTTKWKTQHQNSQR